MAKREYTPAQVLKILIERIDKRKEILSRVSSVDYQMAQAELDIVRRQLVKAQDYLVKTYSETTIRNQR
jgi:hypothetical protein